MTGSCGPRRWRQWVSGGGSRLCERGVWGCGAVPQVAHFQPCPGDLRSLRSFSCMSARRRIPRILIVLPIMGTVQPKAVVLALHVGGVFRVFSGHPM
ncbi:hypothetical protein NDU88_003481 [Pleurodeles waltl]|uniref:Uncharacterized protein n=1 Tax=Pleurodeles waltl TaxID=8319 RepID=A0AAV7T5P4_PLEWA|nr:hypothetical protein NDU88_003481 [Pleurodeles waltl]